MMLPGRLELRYLNELDMWKMRMLKAVMRLTEHLHSGEIKSGFVQQSLQNDL